MTQKTEAVDLKAWVGHKRIEQDVIVPSQAQAMAALLDREPDQFSNGTPLPELWHWIYFRPVVRQSRLGEDGHEKRGDFLPPVQLPRRMWAGGRLKFLKPIVIGNEVERRSEIVSVDQKTGKSGDLVVVTVRHTVSGSNGVCVDEEQDLAYCEIPKSNQSPRQQDVLPDDVQWKEIVVPDAVMLFRYSALMFNAHRIHYDHPFTIQVEGYRGLVVHGPLTASLLLDAAKHHTNQTPTSYNYRAIGPLFSDEPITLAGRINNDVCEAEVWAADPSGTIAMQACMRWQN
ncbi:MAG: MaoC family dehydratase N-terminal domain-containing protein [Acidiferrobacterales bacterium]